MIMEKVAILNDIHGNLYLLNKVLDYLREQNISRILVCGDFLTDGPDDNKIIETLKKLNADIILGNREEEIIKILSSSNDFQEKHYPLYYTAKNLTEENLKFIQNLSTSKLIKLNGTKILMSHGSPYNTKDITTKDSYQTFDTLINDYDADIYLFAHTHEYFEQTYRNKLFLNTGSINCFHGDTKTTFGILTITKTQTTFEEIKLPYNFSEVKKYYMQSKYYEECPEWSNIILYMLKTGINYSTKFTKSYDYSKSMKNNFYKFKFIYNLPTFKEDL